MKKSLESPDYKLFLRVLKRQRNSSGLSQETLATILDETQSFISKCERGERRIDIIELRLWCDALGISLKSFLTVLEKELNANNSQDF